ncbi:MAG: hypothetical protein KJ041_05085 [Gammaproteobacteria bacterium]|nr:hypothetical protein [Gammaproteobacteria bacterium]
MHDGISGLELWQFLHVVVFVFWLGPEFAIYIWSRKLVEPGVLAEQRVVAGRMMASAGLITRAMAALMLTVGGVLSDRVGLSHPWWQMAGIVLLGPVWLTLVLAGAARDGTPFGATALRLENALRWVLIVLVPLSVAWAWSTGRLAMAPYVGSKLLLFAAVLLFAQQLRARLAPLRAGLDEFAAGRATPATEQLMRTSLARSRVYNLALWAGLLLAALLGVIRPGT